MFSRVTGLKIQLRKSVLCARNANSNGTRVLSAQILNFALRERLSRLGQYDIIMISTWSQENDEPAFSKQPLALRTVCNSMID